MSKFKPEIHQTLKTVFLTRVPFPHGMAQTNRLLAITGGLVQAGLAVTVICLKPSETQRNSPNNLSSGQYNGIRFLYTSGTPFRGKSILRRSFLYAKGLIYATRFLFKEHKQGRIGSVFVGVTGSTIIAWYYLICRILKIPYLQERSEYPFIKAKHTWFDKPSLFIYLHVVCRFFDGFVVITHTLRDYFIPHLRKSCPVFLLPILVEPERFAPVPGGNPEKYVAYCGSMAGNKDGLPILIDAFHLIAPEYPDLKLYLVGSTAFREFGMLQHKIRDLELEERVVFTGTADRDHLPGMLANAVMLVLARPLNKQAEAGFPTKLGEYLATGKPVVVTRVGEIPDYLTHRKNAFMATPGDAADFADKMREVLADYPFALEVGKEGQRLAQTVFSYIFQGKELAKWLNQLKGNG